MERIELVGTYSVDLIIQNANAHSTPPLAHRRHDLPFVAVRLRIEHLDRGDGIAAAPAAHCEQHLAGDTFARPIARDTRGGARRATREGQTFLGQQMKVLGLVDEIATRLVLSYERIGAHFGHQILGLEQRQTHVTHYLRQMGSPLVQIVLYPVHARLVDLLLALHVQLVVRDDLEELSDRQEQKLVRLDDVDEVVLQVFVGDLEQFAA